MILTNHRHFQKIPTPQKKWEGDDIQKKSQQKLDYPNDMLTPLVCWLKSKKNLRHNANKMNGTSKSRAESN